MILGHRYSQKEVGRAPGSLPDLFDVLADSSAAYHRDCATIIEQAMNTPYCGEAETSNATKLFISNLIT